MVIAEISMQIRIWLCKRQSSSHKAAVVRKFESARESVKYSESLKRQPEDIETL